MTLSLQEISDRFEISDLLTRYTRAIDTKDFELLDTCFTPDAFVDYTSSGGISTDFPGTLQKSHLKLSGGAGAVNVVVDTSSGGVRLIAE